MKATVRFAVLTLVCMVCLQSCFDSATAPDNGACDAGKENVIQRVIIDSTVKILPQSATRIPGNTAYYRFEGGIAHYYIAVDQNNICSKEHLNVKFDAVLSVPNGESAELKIYGEVFYSIIFRPYSVEHCNGKMTGSSPIFREVSVGLKQAYPDKPATIEAFLNVEFPSRGTSSLDDEYFRKVIERLTIDFTYDKHQ